MIGVSLWSFKVWWKLYYNIAMYCLKNMIRRASIHRFSRDLQTSSSDITLSLGVRERERE